MKSARFSLLSVGLLSLACAVGPNHETPEVKTPEQFRGDKAGPPAKEGESPSTLADLPWWEVYRDRQLFLLLKEATENAFDLRIAMARVEAARHRHTAAAWALAPTVGLSGGVGDSIGSPSVPGIYPPVDATSNFGIGAGASWEADVWGRLRRLREVALHDYQATDEDRRGIYIALVGDTAELYFRLLSLDQQKAAADRAVETRSKTASFFRERSQGGVGNELEVARAEASEKQAEAEVTRLALAIANTENALSFLLGRVPGPIPRETSLDAVAALPSVPMGLPSALLERRPDIRAADHRLAAANAQIGVQQANYFPKFELTGFLGLASPDLKEAEAIRGGAALFSWTLPFLGGQKITEEYEAAKALWTATTVQYERVVTNAFREVADGLAAVSTLSERREALEQQLSALERSETLAITRYQGGVANYLDVLTAQESLLIVQLLLADVKGSEKVAVARLYRTLGGGWPIESEAEKKKKREEKAEK